jgi:DHA2 family metal-tetracycline-proton antiporter-like MFS transporter
VIFGKLADIYKLKNLLTFGLTFFAAGSMIGLFAQAYWMVLLGRILQAVGASVIPAIAGIIPIRYVSSGHRGRAFGMVAVGLALGRVLSPIIAAFVVSVSDWRWLFCLPLLTLLLLPFYRKYLNDEPRNQNNIDWIGAGLLGGTVALLLLAVTKGSVLLAIGSIILLLLFVMRIRVAAKPFVQAVLFQNKQYSLGLMVTFLASGIGFSFIFMTPLLLSDANQLGSGLIGFIMAPAAILSVIFGKKGGKWADTNGNTFLFYLASTLLLIGLVLFSSFAGISVIFIAIFLIFGDVGQTFVIIALSNTISRTLSEEQSGVGMGIFQMLNFIAGSVAGAVFGKAVDIGASFQWNPVNSYPGTTVYSNIYLVLGILTVGITMFYHFQYRKKISDNGDRTILPKGRGL